MRPRPQAELIVEVNHRLGRPFFGRRASSNSNGSKVFLACQPIDLRAGFDGPADNVQQIIGADPFSSYVFSELMPWAYQSPTGEAAG
jgi:hypothetical protein